ncbi:hypothetical protein EON68_00650, partial [archaeon]
MAYAEVTLDARQMLINHQQPSARQRRAAVATLLRAIGEPELRSGGDRERASVAEDAMCALVDDAQPLLDVLMTLYTTKNTVVRRNAAEVYVRRLHRMYNIHQLTVEDAGFAPAFKADAPGALDFLSARWSFTAPHLTGTLRMPPPPSSSLASVGRQSARRGEGDDAMSRASSAASELDLGSRARGTPPQQQLAQQGGGGMRRTAAGMSYIESYGDLQALSSMSAWHSSSGASVVSKRSGDSMSAAGGEGGAGGGGGSPDVGYARGLTRTPPQLPVPRTCIPLGTEESGFVYNVAEASADERQVMRFGAMAAFASLAHFRARIPAVLHMLLNGSTAAPAPVTAPAPAAAPASAADAVHVLHVCLLRSPALDPTFALPPGLVARPRTASSAAAFPLAGGDASTPQVVDDETLERAVVDCLRATLADMKDALAAAHVRRITFSVPSPKETASRSSHTPLLDAAKQFVANVTSVGWQLSVSSGRTPALGAQPAPSTLAGMPALSLSPDAACDGGAESAAAAAAAPLLAEDAEEEAAAMRASFPWIYTFRASLGYAEDSIVRHIEPPASAHLELGRLSNFKIRPVATANRIIHVYAAEPNPDAAKAQRASGGVVGGDGSGERGAARLRFFVRAIVRQTARIPTLDSVYEQYPGPERMFVECLDALSVAMGDALQDTASPVGNNHIFLNVLPVSNVRPEYIEDVTKILARRYAERLRRLRVSQVEFKIRVAGPNGTHPIPLRLVSSNPTGYVLRVDTYVEAKSEDAADARVTSAGGISPAAPLAGNNAPAVFTSVAPAS